MTIETNLISVSSECRGCAKVELGEFRAKIQEFQTLCMRVRTHKRDASHFPSGFFFQREQTFKLDRNISLSEKRLNSILYILVLKKDFPFKR